jgi:hypothetical protein
MVHGSTLWKIKLTKDKPVQYRAYSDPAEVRVLTEATLNLDSQAVIECTGARTNISRKRELLNKLLPDY